MCRRPGPQHQARTGPAREGCPRSTPLTGPRRSGGGVSLWLPEPRGTHRSARGLDTEDQTMSSIPDQRTRRVAVITGASSGIGAATARALATKGLRVVLLSGRGRAERIDDLARELRRKRHGYPGRRHRARPRLCRAGARLRSAQSPRPGQANHARALDDPAIGTIAAAHGKTPRPK